MPVITAKPLESEKVTINLGLVDLGKVDLMVQEGFYSSRTDFIRTAIRNHLATHEDHLRQAVTRKALVLGLMHLSRGELEAAKKARKRLRIDVVGLARIADDVPPELALATIDSVRVLGAFQASAAVRAALKDRIQ